MDEISVLKSFFEKAGEVAFYNVSYEDLSEDIALDDSLLKDYFPSPIDFCKTLLKNLDRSDFLEENEWSLKERLFECFMVRIEDLRPYQYGLKRLILEGEKSLFCDGRTVPFLREIMPFLLKSMGFILNKVGMEAQVPKKMALLIVFGIILRVWARDETPDLSKTLQALDHALDLLRENYEAFS